MQADVAQWDPASCLPVPTYDLRQEEAAADGRGKKKKRKGQRSPGAAEGCPELVIFPCRHM